MSLKSTIKTAGYLLVTILVLLNSTFAEDKFKVGFIASLSGAAKIYGDAAKNGFELGLEDYQNKEIEVFYEDDQFMPSKTVAAFKKLADLNKVDLVVTVGSTPSNSVAPLAFNRNIPLVSWASDRRVSRGRPNVIRSYPSGFAEGSRAAKEAARLGFNRFAVLISQNNYAQSWHGGFVGTVPKESLLMDQELSVPQKDFQALLLKAQKRGAKQFAICLDPGMSGVFAKQSREIGINVPIFGCEYLHDSQEVKAAQGALDQSWFVTVPIEKTFRDKYVARYKNDSIISGAANHYDLAVSLLKVIRASKTKDTAKALVSLGPQNGAVGRFEIREDGDDRFFDIPLIIKKAKRD